VIYTSEVEQIVSVGQLIIGKRKSWIAFNRLVQQANGLGQALRLRCAKNSSRDERFGADVQIVSCKISRWLFLDCRLFVWRDFSLKLRDYLPSQLAFDCKHIGDVAIVTFRPKLAVRPGIDQLGVDAHSTTGALDCAF
jgi:hypothetical protein